VTQAEKREHAIRVRTDIAATLNGLAKDYDALIVIDMAAAFVAKMLNACLLAGRMTNDQVSQVLCDATENAYFNAKQEPEILIAPAGSVPTGRLQ
jgi:hypothetical protein